MTQLNLHVSLHTYNTICSERRETERVQSSSERRETERVGAGLKRVSEGKKQRG